MQQTQSGYRVGLLTCFKDNYGACLQAYALQQTLLSYPAASDCEIVKYTEYSPYRTSVASPLRLIYWRLRGLFQPRYLVAYNRARRAGKFDAFRQTMLSFTEQEYPDVASIYAAPPDFDLFVCGSDRIWDPTIYRRNQPVYHLDFVPQGKRRIAYAPSISQQTLPEEYREEFVRYVSNMDAVSVREASGAQIVSSLTGRPCPWVLDPTLLFDADRWRALAAPRLHAGPYLFCYLLGRRPYLGAFIRHMHEKTGLPVLCVTPAAKELYPEAQLIYGAGPLEFLSLIAHAAWVVTDSFHGTAFSVNLGKPFYSLLRCREDEPDSFNVRVTDLLAFAGLTDRLIRSEADFPEVPDAAIDDTAVRARLAEKRQESLAYLQNALNGKDTVTA